MQITITILVASAFFIAHYHYVNKVNRKVKKITKISDAFSRTVNSSISAMSISNHICDAGTDSLSQLSNSIDLLEYNFKEDEKLFLEFDEFQKQNAILFYDNAIGSLKKHFSENPELGVKELMLLDRLVELLVEIRFKLTIERDHGNN